MLEPNHFAGRETYVHYLHGRRFLIYWSLVAYMCVVQLGSLFRLNAGGFELGLSTMLAGCIIALGFFSIDLRVAQSPLAVATGILVLLATLGAAFSPFNLVDRGRAHAELFLYWSLALVVASQFFSRAQTYGIVFASVAGLLIASSLTMIDFLGIKSIPRCNELDYSSVAMERGTTRRVNQASGFFPLRTAMASYYSLSITASYFIFIYGRQRREKLIGVAAFLAGLACVIATHNRSASISSAVAILVFLLFRKEHDGTRQAKRWVLTLLAMSVIVSISIVFLGDHVRVYLSRTGYLFGHGDGARASDLSRFELFWYAIDQVTQYPLGRGMTKMQLSNGIRISPHNVVTAVVWAIGFSAFVWVPWFAYLMFRESLSRRGDVANILSFSLLAWMLNNMMHESLSTGAAWVVFGLFLSVSANGNNSSL